MFQLIFLSLFFATINGQSCSKYLQYTRNYYGEIEGLIKIPPFQAFDHQLKVGLTIVDNFKNGYVGDVSLYKSQPETINDLTTGFPISYRVRFPNTNPVPTVTRIIYNGVTICAETKKFAPNFLIVTLSHSFKATVLPKFKNNVNSNPSSASFSANRIFGENPIYSKKTQSFHCGVRNASPRNYVVAGLVIGGMKASQGSFPWLAAHFHRTRGFICGGSIVSQKIIVTAGHCIWNKGDSSPVKEYDSTYYLGKYKLKDLSENGYVSSDVVKFIIHPGWRPSSDNYDSDIAIAVLTKKIQFTPYIQPICIWFKSKGHRDLVNKKGFIAGWGISNKKKKVASDYPMYVQLPAVDDAVCLRSHDAFRRITSEKNFCVGDGSGRTPCLGDSGGAWVIKDGEQYYLRGIISAALTVLEGDDYVCSSTDYAVFTDVSYFSGWINDHVKRYG